MTGPEIPNFAALLAEPIAQIPPEAVPGFLSQLERRAGDRYREWAEQAEALAPGLLACAAREYEIADRAEKLFPIPEEHREQVAAVLPRAVALFLGVFEGHSVEDQLVIQAHAERQGALAWKGLAAQATDESQRAELLALAGLEVESADHVDAVLGTRSTSEA